MFVDFVLSDEGQLVISKTGTVNLAEGAALNPLWLEKKKKLGIALRGLP
jgi:ABC-type Fe3+ transport system substrate-binding protein